MPRPNDHRFAHQELPRAVFADPLAFARAAENATTAKGLLEPLWAAAFPTEKLPDAVSMRIERRQLYVFLHISLPAPRGSGDPIAVVIVGRGDGISRLGTVGYYTLDLAHERTGDPRFVVSVRSRDDRTAVLGDCPAPDPSWFAEYAWENYTGNKLGTRRGVPSVPTWYWWELLRGAEAVAAFAAADDVAKRVEVTRQMPVLLVPAIADAAELYLGAKPARTLRELRPYLERDPSFAPAWKAAVMRLAQARGGSPAANLTAALQLVGEIRARGALPRPDSYELEATVLSMLAAIDIDTERNTQLANEAFAASRGGEGAPRLARGSAPPPVAADDPSWATLLLDPADVPGFTLRVKDDVFASGELAFTASGGVRAGAATWGGDPSWPVTSIVDMRWLFTSPAAAVHWLHAAAPSLGDGLQHVALHPIGEDTLAFWSAGTWVVVFRVGRVVGKLVISGGAVDTAYVASLAQRAADRAVWSASSYWLAIANKAVGALARTPIHSEASLLPEFPILVHPELPRALALLGDPYTAEAQRLRTMQLYLRDICWRDYCDAMRALTAALVLDRVGHPRVNAAHAYEIAAAMQQLDTDPSWSELAAWVAGHLS